MKIVQLSLFLENRPGHLSSICRTLADAGVNILTLSLADTQQFGVLRVIVDDTEKARTALEKTAAVAMETEVVATEVDDRPGGLAAILEVLEQASVNVEYMYAFAFGTRNRAVMVFRFDDPDRAVTVLQEAGVAVLDPVELYGNK